MATGRWLEQRERFENGEGLKGPTLRSTRANEEETAMSKSFKALGLAVSALALTHLPASAQTKVTNEGISATEIVVGTHQDLSGPIKGWGVPVSNGMKMAVEEVNAAGGINGKKIEVTLLDDECKPDKGISNVNRFIHQNKVHLVMGSTCSSVTLPMVDITAKEEVPHIVPHSTNSNITRKNSAWVFRTSVSERFYASVHAKYLAENAGKKVAFLYTNDGAAIGFAKDYMAFMKKTYGVDPAYEAQMQETDLDFRSHLLKIKSLGVDVLAIGGQLDAIARIAQQSIEVGIDMRSLGTRVGNMLASFARTSNVVFGRVGLIGSHKAVGLRPEIS